MFFPNPEPSQFSRERAHRSEANDIPLRGIS
jgi:hypothetical protein